MKRLLILTILIFSVLFSMTAGESSPPTIAVMDVVATNTSTIKSQVIYEYIVDVVNRRNLYTLVERSALKDAVKEMEISASGMIDDTTAAQIGKLAGAEFILISNLIVDDGITYLSARIVSVETGQVSNTAMLQAGESEYIASLANRTISQLLGQPEGKPGPPADEVVETETEVVEEKAKEEPARVVKKEDPKPVGTQTDSKLSLTAGATGIIPVLDDSEIFSIGYGLIVDVNYKVVSFGSGIISIGAGTGFFFDAATVDKGVVFPYNMLSVPLSINAKYRMDMNKLYFTGKIAAGATFNMFMYTDIAPTDETTELAINPAIFPCISVGYKLSEKMGLALFCNWSMTFFKELPYTALNTGLAVDIEL